MIALVLALADAFLDACPNNCGKRGGNLHGKVIGAWDGNGYPFVPCPRCTPVRTALAAMKEKP